MTYAPHWSITVSVNMTAVFRCFRRCSRLLPRPAVLAAIYAVFLPSFSFDVWKKRSPAAVLAAVWLVRLIPLHVLLRFNAAQLLPICIPSFYPPWLLVTSFVCLFVNSSFSICFGLLVQVGTCVSRFWEWMGWRDASQTKRSGKVNYKRELRARSRIWKRERWS